MMNGEAVETQFSYLCVVLVGGHEVKVDCLVSDIAQDYDILIGMDTVVTLSGVSVSGDGRCVALGSIMCPQLQWRGSPLV